MRTNVNATDPDAADTLTYGLTQAPSGMTIDPASGVIAWTPAATHVPTVNVTAQVLDGKGGSATQSFVIAVAAAPPPNQSPTITSDPVTSATEGLPYSYDVNAADPNPGDIVSVLAHAGAERDDNRSVERRDLLGAARQVERRPLE